MMPGAAREPLKSTARGERFGDGLRIPEDLVLGHANQRSAAHQDLARDNDGVGPAARTEDKVLDGIDDRRPIRCCASRIIAIEKAS